MRFGWLRGRKHKIDDWTEFIQSVQYRFTLVQVGI